MDINKSQKLLDEKYGGAVKAFLEDGTVFVRGKLDKWEDIIDACSICAEDHSNVHVVNDIEFSGHKPVPMRVPDIKDDLLEGDRPDVLVIGGGISGASITRELTKWKLNVLLLEKEADLAMQASGRNDGEVHPGVDLGLGSLKQKYVVRGNRMYDQLCKDLNVPFERYGQTGVFTQPVMRPIMGAFAWHRKHVCKITDTRIISKKELFKTEPNVNPKAKFGLVNPSAGCVCPYGLTIAYGDNAIENGARISLNTAVLSMKVEDGRIISVTTNRGTLYPRLVINAAGVFAEDIASMAQDRFYSIHPRRGTNSITDRKTGNLVNGVTSVKLLGKTQAHTKGGAIIHTVHDNLLIGPDAVETWEKENFATTQASINTVFDKQTITAPALKQTDIITYFTGVRAPTFEEDFVIEKGRKTSNLIHCAGIQSPGLTTAPAVAIDVSKMAVEMLSFEMTVEENRDFNPVRKGITQINKLSPEERDKKIKENPDYGIIICRCEEISKGEIIDALKSPLCVPTVDGIKKRVRPGMGRCQGGFCMPLVISIISEYTGMPEEEVKKAGKGAFICYSRTK